MAQVKGRLAVLTGGGDCPGLNAVIRAVVKTALKNGYEIYGIENGFNGLITGTMKLMDYASVSGILPRGGTILGTTNRDNPFHFAVEENGKVKINLTSMGVDKLLGFGKISKSYDVIVAETSALAREKIEAAGGSIIEEL